MCYVETKSLDGETNLKVRRVVGPLVGKVGGLRVLTGGRSSYCTLRLRLANLGF
jgi:hypothetical protein